MEHNFVSLKKWALIVRDFHAISAKIFLAKLKWLTLMIYIKRMLTMIFWEGTF